MFEIVLTLCLETDPNQCAEYWGGSLAFQTVELCETWQSKSDFKGLTKAHCKERPNTSLEFEEIASGVFVHIGEIALPSAENAGNVSNIGFIIGDKAVLAIDAGGSLEIGNALYLAIREKTELPITYLALTHMHPDHVFGADAFRAQDTLIIGHQNLGEALLNRVESYRANYASLLSAQSMGLMALPTIDMALNGALHIDLGQRPVVLETWPTAHSNNDMTVYDLTTQTLFTGDLLFHEHIPVIDGALRGWQHTLEGLTSRELGLVIPGHGAPGGGEMFALQSQYFETLAGDTKAAIEAGERMNNAVQTIAAGEKKHWMLFDEYNPRNASVAFSELEWE